MAAMISTAPNIAIAQFLLFVSGASFSVRERDTYMLSGVTGLVNGQTYQNSIGVVNISETILIGRPHRPRDQRRAGSGSPASRRQIRHPTVILYEKSRDTVPRELKALNAA
jgi:hypothetical protein